MLLLIKRTFYPDLISKASIPGFSLVMNHPFIDGNKRIGHAALETLLFLNGSKLEADVDEQERVILGVASGEISLSDFENWVRSKAKKVEK